MSEFQGQLKRLYEQMILILLLITNLIKNYLKVKYKTTETSLKSWNETVLA